MISTLSCLCVFDFPFKSICIIRGRELTEICHLSHEKTSHYYEHTTGQNDTQIIATGREGEETTLENTHPQLNGF